MELNIPAGKQIILLNGSESIVNVPITLATDISVTLSSSFGPILGDMNNKFLTIASQVTQDLGWGGVSGSFKEMGYQVWQGTDTCKFSFDAIFHMKTSAREDVWIPAMTLAKLPLPIESEDNNTIGLKAPGPSILSAFGDNVKYKAKNNFSVRIGKLYLPNAIIKGAEPTMSSETDEDGYPIWVSIKLDVESLFTATTKLINGWL